MKKITASLDSSISVSPSEIHQHFLKPIKNRVLFQIRTSRVTLATHQAPVSAADLQTTTEAAFCPGQAVQSWELWHCMGYWGVEEILQWSHTSATSSALPRWPAALPTEAEDTQENSEASPRCRGVSRAAEQEHFQVKSKNSKASSFPTSGLYMYHRLILIPTKPEFSLTLPLLFL